MEVQKTPNRQSNPEKEEQNWRYHNSRFQHIVQNCNNPNSLIWAHNRQVQQWNRIEMPEIDSHLYGRLICDKGRKIYNGRKDSLFNKWCWENWASTWKRMKLDYFLTPYTKINSKQIKDLNMRPETIKPLDENTGSNLSDVSLSNVFLDRSPQTRETNAKINY